MQRPDRFGEEIDLLENATWLTNDGQPKSIEALRKRKAHPAIIAAAKLFRCSACMESERRKLRPMASEKIYKPGEHLSGDQFEWVHPTEDIRVLGTILADIGSRTAVVKIQRQGGVNENLGNITGQMATETLRTHWTKFYGRPVMFHTDPEGCFSSNEFKRKLAAMNIMPAPIPGEAAWKIGLLDKVLDTIKESATRAARRLPSSVSIQELFDMTCEVHNDLHPRGSSPFQLLIGRTPRGVGITEDRQMGQISAELNEGEDKTR